MNSKTSEMLASAVRILNATPRPLDAETSCSWSTTLGASMAR
jgi:hypothetical protein